MNNKKCTIIDDEMLDIAVKSVKKAGYKAESIKYSAEYMRKENDSIVTTADKNAQKIIRSILKENSNYTILGEEQGGNVEKESNYWVVDPIDGTRNFSCKQPIYGSAVASEGWVASGWCDVGVFGALAPWDMAVGVLLVRESNGIFKSISGESNWDSLKNGKVIFGNQILVDKTIKSFSNDAIETIKNTNYNY